MNLKINDSNPFVRIVIMTASEMDDINFHGY